MECGAQGRGATPSEHVEKCMEELASVDHCQLRAQTWETGDLGSVLVCLSSNVDSVHV